MSPIGIFASSPHISISIGLYSFSWPKSSSILNRWCDPDGTRMILAHSGGPVRHNDVAVTMIDLRSSQKVKLDTFDARMFEAHELIVDWIDHKSIAIGMNTYGTVIFELDSPRNHYINDYDNFGPNGRLQVGVFQKRAKFGWKYVTTRVRDHVDAWFL